MLDNFDELDINEDGFLSFSEAQARIAGLMRSEFDALDTNEDGLLSKDELDKTPPVNPGGCPASKLALPRLGDLFLLGIALVVLLGTSALGRRI